MRIIIIIKKTSASKVLSMSGDKPKPDVERNYSDETFYTDSSEEVQSKCKSSASLLQKRRQLRPMQCAGNPYRNTTRMATFTPGKNNNSIAQKIMSAKALRSKQLQNELMNAQFQINELVTENRILRTLQKRQDMALKKYEGTQAELPSLLRSHNEEVRTLKVKLKQAKIQNRDLETRLKNRESELLGLREQHKHLLKLSKDKHLGEREQLQQQLEHIQELLKEQDKKVQMLTRKAMLEGKNFKHQLSTEISRHKVTAKELDVALDKITQLEAIIETKEKYIAANLPRMNAHNSISLMSLGPAARFRVSQPQVKATNVLNPLKENMNTREAIADRDEDDEDDDNYDEDDDDVGTSTEEEEEREMLTMQKQRGQSIGGQQKRQVFQNKKDHPKIEDGGNLEDEDDEGDESDDADKEDNYEQQGSVRSISSESNTYVSKTSTNVSLENIHKESKGSHTDGECKSNSSKKVPGKLKPHVGQSAFQTEMEKHLEMLPTGDKGLRRYSIGGDSLPTPEEQNGAGRRGSFNGTGEPEKKEFSFLSSLTSEIDKQNFMRRNSVGKKKFPVESKTVELERSASKKHLSSKENFNEMEKTNTNSESSQANRTEISQPEDRKELISVRTVSEMTVEEGREHLKNINRTWEEIQNKIREETNRAQSMMEKYDEELRDAGVKLPSAAESYNKKHLLAALKAIDNGADPIDLVDEVKEKRTSLSGIKTKKTENQNCSQTIENLHKGLPAHAPSSVSVLEKNKSERNNFWESESNVHSNPLLSREPEAPKTKADLMQELFGSHKSDGNSYCLDSLAVPCAGSLSECAQTMAPMGSRLQQK